MIDTVGDLMRVLKKCDPNKKIRIGKSLFRIHAINYVLDGDWDKNTISIVGNAEAPSIKALIRSTKGKIISK